MEIKILGEKNNPLFNRKEIQVSLFSEISPNKKEVKKLISEKFSAHEENIKIKKISGKFGSKDFLISVNIYSSKEDKERIEGKSKKEHKIEKAKTEG